MRHASQQRTHRLRRWLLRVVGSCVLALTLSACTSEIASNIDQNTARAIERTLLANNIETKVTQSKSGAFAVSVDDSSRLIALNIIANAGLPHREFSSIEKLFPASGLIVTPLEQRARLSYGVEQELAQTLSALAGVQSARVQISSLSDDGRTDTTQKTRASALIVYRHGANTAVLQDEARRLILNSLPDLSFEDISIVLSPYEEPVEMEIARAARNTHTMGDAYSAFSGLVAIAIALILVTFAGSLASRALGRRRRLPALPIGAARAATNKP